MNMPERWYRDPKLLKAAYERYGSLEAAARNVGGVHKATLATAWKDLGLGKLPKGPSPKAANEDALRELHKSVYGK